MVGLRGVGLQDDLRFAVQKSSRLRQLYRNYPVSPEGFPEWHKELLREMNGAHERFPI